MKTKITITLLLLCTFSFAQNRKGEVHLQPGSSSHRLYVAFNSNITENKDYLKAIAATVPGFAELRQQYGIVPVKAINIPDTKLDEMEQTAIRLTGSGSSVAKLRNIAEFTISAPTNERLLQLALNLEKQDGVAYCCLMPATPVHPPGDIAPVTPLVEDMQGYISLDGVKMDYAWQMGLTGEGIKIRDVEYGFNPNHEELNERNVALGPDMAISDEAGLDYTEHGTAVFGILYADKGDYGISGMAYGADEVVLFPEWQPFDLGGYNRINAITQCMAYSVPGDVVLFEMQTGGAQGNFCQAEYDQLVWDLTKAATDAGIVVVAAAGNGYENLDADEYISYMDRGDSGAIIVGAGSPDDLHDRLDYSTYGTRVDVQGWGYYVYSSGYGDAGQIGGDFNQSYTNFSGTSSATPIVASCVIVLQSYYHGLTGEYLTGPQMRDLLKATGTPQGAGMPGNIGPLPDMENAIAEVGNIASAGSFDKDAFTVYPNPVQDKLMLTTQYLSGNAKAEVYNALGQMVYSTAISANNAQIDFSTFSKGIYSIKVIDAEKTVTKRVIKK
jgi:hypothetical protein